MTKLVGFRRRISDFVNDKGVPVHNDKVDLFSVDDEIPDVVGITTFSDTFNYDDFTRLSNVSFDDLSSYLDCELLIVTKKICNKEVTIRIIFEGK